tara:strand:+ start:62 stop:568 length:507 start_codon:yes stop_codon:yes gene_type:complete
MEIFTEIKGFEDYEVSNLGRVKSLARIVTTVKGTYSCKEKILKPTVSGDGYNTVGLYKNGKCKTKKVHQLVAIAFLNHKPNGLKLVVDHIDNNPLNNKLGNLQIISQRNNLSKDKKGSSKYTGVSWHKPSKKWISHISINGKIGHLGLFVDELEASKAYQNALSKLVK